MSQIRSDILYTRKIKEARECEREVQRLHIAAPICPDDEIENHEPTTQEIDIQVSDDEDEFNNDDNNNEDELTTEEEQRWSHIIKEWIELGNRENQFEDKNDADFLSSEWDSDFNFAGRELHPADDELAKWMLSTLFEISLESPAFLGSDEIFTNAH
ncbi:unnamed protein product [Rhizophagus irregularis]|uniref:Uncharacterized protein n=1 Tax=Rhizophagus irregularis TaxID=588596 RepID=A0A2N1M8A3_9GLOM|nr:hypothetical protein RhiirC2_720936 [Rhizophagus irregularis]CAB4399227.1 unnamed protein product [Rhizophagus irregularis]CAB5389960.1 unnamed protein product [Rhizophagus irregularis]